MVTDNKSMNQEAEKPVDESEFLDDIFAGGDDIDEFDFEDEDDDLEGDDDTF